MQRESACDRRVELHGGGSWNEGVGDWFETPHRTDAGCHLLELRVTERATREARSARERVRLLVDGDRSDYGIQIACIDCVVLNVLADEQPPSTTGSR
jgi:hypothetical protein